MERFFVIARLETHNWDPDTLADAGIRAAFGLYLIREGERTHCCSLTPSSRADFLQNAFVMEAGGPLPDEFQDLEYEGDSGETSYFDLIDPATYDARFISGPIEIDPADCSHCPEYGETLTDSLWDAARESFNANSEEPGILWDATFDAWETEQTAKRRAENRPPCRGPEPLPLFMAPALALRDAIALRHGVKDDRAEWDAMRAADQEIKSQLQALAWY